MYRNLKIIILFWIVFMGQTNAQINFGSILQKGEDAAGKVAADKGPDLAKQAEEKIFKKKSSPAPKDSTALAARSEAGMKLYAGYDFVPAEHILFEDHLADDPAGEFPMQWDLRAGQAQIDMTAGEKAIAITSGINGLIAPKMKTAKYLTDTFTLELDYYLTHPKDAPEAAPLHILLHSRAGYDADITISRNSVSYDDAHGIKLSNDLHAEIKGDTFAGRWHHIALSYRRGQMKVYVDQYRTLVVPDTRSGYTSLAMGGAGTEASPVLFCNVRIATGGSVYPAGKKYTGTSIVTHGIAFEEGRAILRPESMGTLNMIAQVMRDNPDIKFEVDVHTDSDGDAIAGLTLTQQRADQIRGRLVRMGIDAARLTAKGFGMAKPMTDNDTPEGKANNRRIVFTKI